MLRNVIDSSNPSSDPASERKAAIRRALERTPRLLIIRLRSLGDSILALPLVEALHAWRSELHIDLLVEVPYAGVFARHPAVHETLVVARRRGTAISGWSRARACREIWKRRYDVVLNLHGGSTSSLFTLASGARLRIGQEKYRQAWVYNARIPPPPRIWQRTDLHTVEDQLTLLRWLDLPVPDSPGGRLYLDAGAAQRVRARLETAGLAHRGAVLIHPTATLRTKQWPESNFAGLADRLSEDQGVKVVFTAAPEEAQVLLDIGRHATRSHHYWSDLGLDDLLALIDQCRLFVGNDSGPTHAAAALGRPLVVIWGSSDYRVWHPWNTPFESVGLSLPCMPCPGYRCAAFDRPKCIEEVSVEMVLAACARTLGSGR